MVDHYISIIWICDLSLASQILKEAKNNTVPKVRVVVYNHTQGDYLIISTCFGFHRFDFSGFTCEKELAEYIELATEIVAAFMVKSKYSDRIICYLLNC